MKFYESDEFKKLNSKWKKSLKKSGFEDLEETVKGGDGSDDRLKNWTANIFRGRYNATQHEARVDYYRIAGQFLHDYRFKKGHKAVWDAHTQGKSYVVISKDLGGKPTSRQVRQIIEDLQGIMYARYNVRDTK